MRHSVNKKILLLLRITFLRYLAGDQMLGEEDRAGLARGRGNSDD